MPTSLSIRIATAPSILALACMALLAQPLHAEGAAPMLNSSDVLNTVGGLIVVLALLLGLAWLVKRYMSVPGISKGRIQVVGGVSLGPRERAVIVEVDGARLLLGVAQGNVRLLDRLESVDVAQESFQQTLAGAQQEQQEAER